MGWPNSGQIVLDERENSLCHQKGEAVILVKEIAKFVINFELLLDRVILLQLPDQFQ